MKTTSFRHLRKILWEVLNMYLKITMEQVIGYSSSIFNISLCRFILFYFLLFLTWLSGSRCAAVMFPQEQGNRKRPAAASAIKPHL